jgi:prophage regulatory protein
MVNKLRLMGAAEIGERLGVSAQRVQQLVWRRDFPEPFQVLKMGAVWNAADVERWIKEKRPHLAEEAGRPEEP